jgi:hypothetical protein
MRSLVLPIGDTHTAANRLAVAALSCAAVALLFVVGSEQCQHWFVVPVFCCGVFVFLDAYDWAVGRRDVFDPVGIIGALGLHVFFLAPLLHVYWQHWMRYIWPPPDWRPWLGLMACFNLVGLVVYRAVVNYIERHTSQEVSGVSRTVDPKHFPFAWGVGMLVTLAAQAYVLYQFGGVGGYVTAFEERMGLEVFEGMGLHFMVAESVPILAFIGYAVYCRLHGRSPGWGELAVVLLGFMVMRLFFGGLRGSRSNMVWALFWVAGIIHLWLHPIRRGVIVCGLVFMLGFLYLYGFYKAAGREGVIAALTSAAEREKIAEQRNRSIETAVVNDLGRADVQAFLLYRLTREGSDYEYAWGRTYYASAVLLVPKRVWPDRPPLKTKEGTEAMYGMRSYVPGRNVASQIYGLTGEGMLNFGWWVAPLMFIPLGVIVGWTSTLRRRLPPDSVYWLMYPVLVNLCFLVLVSDSDNLMVFSFQNAVVPLLMILAGSTVVRLARPATAGAGGAAPPQVRFRARWGKRAKQQAPAQ